MNERRNDFELLQRFTRRGEQSAFADVVRRHLDLVFGTALRKVEDPGAAQEVAQNVFSVLARKAWQFAPDDSLPAWLHKTALLESKLWLRGEMRRRRREETAAELGTTMKTSENQPAFQALVPLLDEALLSLREKDRTALLLRFYESQSLRDVGAALGAGEDAARKRVESALEKVAEFFNRRGYKTATVAAAAAALQHTATSASATLVSAVVSAALQVAPPALLGLGALLARLASLSRVQTAAVCVALAVVPVGWQLNEGHVAERKLKRIETPLLAGQTGAATVQSEIERLRATSGRLEQSIAQANEAAARAAADAQAFADWKQRIRRPLLAADYRWDDNSPFVRIPKAVLPRLIQQCNAEPFLPSGVVQPFASELLCLSPSERQSVETTINQYFADVEDKWATAIQETNRPLSGSKVAARLFILPVLAEGELKARSDQMLSDVRGIVGEERRALVEARPPDARRAYNTGNQRAMVVQKLLRLEVGVQADDKGRLTVGLDYSYGSNIVGKDGKVYSDNTVSFFPGGALSMFLPEGDPNRTDGVDEFVANNTISNVLRQRAVAWLQDEAIARLGRKEKP